jgi:hypothetical protein
MPVPRGCIHGDLAELYAFQVANDPKYHRKRNYAYDQMRCVQSRNDVEEIACRSGRVVIFLWLSDVLYLCD